MRRDAPARLFFALTAVVALVGIVMAFVNGYLYESPIPEGVGFTTTYGPGWDGAANTAVFYTEWSNAVVCVTTALLAVRLRRTSEAFHVFRVFGLIAITVTAIVFNLLLAGDSPNQGTEALDSTIQHAIVPALAVLGWLLFGPARTVTLRRSVLAALVTIVYAALTLLRGAISDWYPYTILDVTSIGYGGVLLSVLEILVLFAIVVAVFAWVDRLLGARIARISTDPA